MSNAAKDSVLNSLRGRILIAAGALTVVSLLCGLVGYLAVSFAGLPALYALAAAVTVVALATAGFGWWLSNEILRPIETVALLARSLERSHSASLPNTTGAAETDEVLQTLHRNSQQLQNLISLMDDVANGKTDAAMAPLQNPDRLSVSFQKLVSKVIESIEAKQRLDNLQSSVNRLKSGLGDIRRGDLKFEPSGDLRPVEEIADALKFLVGRLNGTAQHVSSGSRNVRDSADDARRIVRSVLESEEIKSLRLKKAAADLTRSPRSVGELNNQLGTSVDAIANAIRLGNIDPSAGGQNAALEMVRRHLAEAIQHVAQLRERATAIPRAARSASEVARRANLLSVNTSLQSDTNSTNTALVAGELASLSARTEAVNKEILSVNESLIAEFVQLDGALASLLADVTEVAGNAARSSEALHAIEKHLSVFSSVRAGMAAYASDHAAEFQALMAALQTNTSDTASVSNLKDAEQSMVSISASASGLLDAISKLKETAVAAGVSDSNGPSIMSTAGQPAPAMTGIQGDN